MQNSSEPGKKSETPKWETAVLLVSFMLLWAWWLARQAAQRAQSDLAIGWQVVLVSALAVLIYVFVRRTKRTVAALKEAQHPGKRGRPERN